MAVFIDARLLCRLVWMLSAEVIALVKIVSALAFCASVSVSCAASMFTRRWAMVAGSGGVPWPGPCASAAEHSTAARAIGFQFIVIRGTSLVSTLLLTPIRPRELPPHGLSLG